MNIKSKLIHSLLPPPVRTSNSQYSMVFPAHDDPSRASDSLISLALEAAAKAREIRLDEISAREKGPPYYVNLWPGEHYRLLAGLVTALRPGLIVEIGTGGGLSALSMKKYLAPSGQIVTFDIIKWRENPLSCLNESDFLDQRLVQQIADLSEPAMVAKHRQLLEKADLIFIDAAKDGVMEEKFLANFKAVAFRSNPLFVFDDIKLWNMLKIWRNIALPKLDLTSLGHWSGTGLVEWGGSNIM